MRALPLILLAACGSSSPTAVASTPPAPTPVEPVEPVEPAPAPAPAPVPPAAPPAKIYDRLRDGDGPVAGLTGFSLKHAPSALHCGGTKVTVARPKKPAAADKQIAAVFAIEFPTGLDFDPARPKVKEASLKKFNDFVGLITKTGTEVARFYTDQTMSTNTSTDEAAKLAAIAHYVQVQFRVVSVFARAEIPKDVRTGEFRDEKIAAYCERMAEMSEPLLERAQTARELCATKVRGSSLTGWWNAVCAGE